VDRGGLIGRHERRWALLCLVGVILAPALWPAGAAAPPAAPGVRGGEATILAVRHFATAGYARVVLVLDRETFDFQSGSLTSPPRLFIDIPGARLGAKAPVPRLQEGESLVREIRVGRPEKGSLRLVLDLADSGVRHRVFTLPEPHRIVIDMRKTTEAKAGPSASAGAADPKSEEGRQGRLERPPDTAEKRRRAMSLSERFRAGLGRIVLDPGHGGKDPGARGLYGLQEKDVALDISLRAAGALRKRLPGTRVVLTRSDDRYVPLEDRTSLANDQDADIFVSIHVNSAPHRHTSGIETYLLSEASSGRALEIAARESEVTVAQMSDLQKILYDLMLRSKVNESQDLAQDVQKGMISHVRHRFPGLNDLGVKRGPFYVLVGAKMPSILIEAAFISNPTEARRIRTANYRQALAEGIAEGIAAFVGLTTRRAASSPGAQAAKRIPAAGP